ncbi:GDP-mannose 4,6-dehydratase [Dankookia sp. P2]|uniref:GDP-mannose 4,6-dehydratase n=1 Tax=Dankookia sp. P2 TaxID=3423955 RepID=UPI003D678032
MSCRRLLEAGHAVAGIDAMVPYYDVRLKQARHAQLERQPCFAPHLFDLTDAARLSEVMAAEAPEVVIHLAAQAGVRYALEHPESYIHANVQGSFCPAGSLQGPACAASADGFHQFGLWRQYHDAVPGDGCGGLATEHLRRN